MKKTIYPFILISLLCSSAWGFECKEVIGKDFYSAGNSEFQYHYFFAKKGIAHFTSLYLDHSNVKDGDHGHSHDSVKSEKFKGSYTIKGNELTLKIKVDKVNHTITFKCADKVQYMNAGPFSRSLQVKTTIPKNHGFSLIDLWPKGSPVIRQYMK